jgi:hypothetical protein
VKAICKKYGFDHSEDVAKDKYDAVCAEIQGADPPPPPQAA